MSSSSVCTPDQPPVCVRGLTHRYADQVALADVDLDVAAGQVHGLLGPNGAGKTTLLRALFGLLRPDTGTVRLFGRDVVADPTGALRPVAGFVGAPRLYPYLTGAANLALLARLDGDGAADRIPGVLATVGLTDRAGTRVRGWSTGMRQRLGLAAALLRDPQLLILDEPASGLDPAGLQDMRGLLARLVSDGRTVLLSSHALDEVEQLCERVTVLRAGSVAYTGPLAGLLHAGPPRSRLTTSDDAAAVQLALQRGAVTVEPTVDGLRVLASRDDLDGYVLALGRAGVAVRRLEPDAAPLLEQFLSLTGPPSAVGAVGAVGAGR